jgi:signal transduction histidine kinase
VDTAQTPAAATAALASARERALAFLRLLAVAAAVGCAGPATAAAASATHGPTALWMLGAASLGALIALAGVVASQQWRARRELATLRASLAASAAWSFRTDAEGRVVEVERGRRPVEWFDCSALVGRGPWEMPGAAAPPALEQAVAARTPYFDVRVSLGGTTPRTLALSAAPLFSGTGAFRGYAGAVHDLTPLLAMAAPPAAELAERDRQLAERAAERDNALRELESFAYSVSHDLRAPLRVVDGFATIVLEDYGDRGKPLDDLGRDHLRRIVAASQRMNSMIETLLGQSRMTSRELARERVDLSQIARELLDDLRAAEPARRIEVVIAPDLRVDGDGTLLRLVLQNLLGNAWKFTAREPQARIEFGTREVDGERAFFVRDNGAGFDMRFAEKLFGLFQRFHSANEFPGTGVGLATVQKIVRRHGGRIWAEAVPAPQAGHGATLLFTIASGVRDR